MPTAFETAARIASFGLFQGFRDLFLPPRCLNCLEFIQPVPDGDGSASADICRDCRDSFTGLPPAHCRRCGRPFRTPLPTTHYCPDCSSQPPVFDQALAAGLFEGGLRLAIHAFKYEGRAELARPLAFFMAQQLEPPFFPPRADLIMPVPLHPRRLRQRGFNQSLLLARALYGHWRDQIRFDLLARTRWTEPQINFSGPDRLKNVFEAFSVLKPDAVRDRAVLLVDDVFTTGATVNECARVLKDAGAGPVLVLTLARVA